MTSLIRAVWKAEVCRKQTGRRHALALLDPERDNNETYSRNGRGLWLPYGVPTQAQVDRVERGQMFAQANCAACHAIGRDGESPLQSAPPLRTLHRRYPVEYLTEALAEGITTGASGNAAVQVGTGPDRRLDCVS